MMFARTIGIDYSGAETADSGLKGLRVYVAEGGAWPMRFARLADLSATGPVALSPVG